MLSFMNKTLHIHFLHCLEIQLPKTRSNNYFIFSLFQLFISKKEEQKKTFITIMGELVPLDDILQETTKVKQNVFLHKFCHYNYKTKLSENNIIMNFFFYHILIFKKICSGENRSSQLDDITAIRISALVSTT